MSPLPSSRWIAVIVPLALLLLCVDELLAAEFQIDARRSLQADDNASNADRGDSPVETARGSAASAFDHAPEGEDETRRRSDDEDSAKALAAAAQELLAEVGEFRRQNQQDAEESDGADSAESSPRPRPAPPLEGSAPDGTEAPERPDARRDEPPPPPVQSREKYFGKIFPETNHVDMPFYLRNTFEPSPRSFEERDVVFFWHVPKTGGQLVKNVMGMCFGLVRAEKLKEPASLEMVHDVIINVDTSTPEGISEAHELGLVDSNSVDFISSSFVLSASSLFTPQHRGRAFTILRHPIDAAASNFYERKVKHAELRGKYTLAQYASKNYYVDNWVTRQLTGTLPHEQLAQAHIDRAKNILAAKFFVGIYEHMDETMRQLKAFYGWKALEGEEYCVTDLIHGSNPKFQKTYRAKPARGSNDWAFVANVEKWDFELYYFALEVFSKQGRIWDADEYSLIEMGRD